MIVAGITGGIGSGKSTVCKVFELLGVPVYYADDESKKLLSSPHISDLIIARFGTSVTSEGHIDRKLLAGVVFNDAQKLEELNGILHPAVKDHFDGWIREQGNVPYVLKEAAILFESGTYRNVQKIITVTAPAEMRIKRVMLRDGLSAEEVKKRMEKQISDEEKIKKSDFVIFNNEQDLVIPQVMIIHQALAGA